ncbi:hypothetical protein PtA15_8A768 [Puccinia triticina]|uniref:Uncharacterized protein n=1 Tax=Puccinia triticina TaxID=208348 RepID=A0ABY7CRG4_9BASI|nr:uncharacterized protein PtA15_8A768 [Puccinia triticina]WAQ87861.1 hypothetical protein PtA15_8A768 [Puccinia triticina]WAR57729.1 hypothetical protein PtB15_8B782 [Puccinia triticina]
MFTWSGRVINRKPPNNLDCNEYNPKSPCDSEKDESKGNKVNEGVQSERSKGNEVDEGVQSKGNKVDEGVQSESQPEDESDKSDDENRNDWVVFNQVC